MTGQELLMLWVAFIRRYVFLSETQAIVVALWAMNTHYYDRFAAVPYLEIVAETKNSGKSTLLKCIALLSRNAEYFGGIVRILTVFRMIEAAKGETTICIDEAEQLSKGGIGELRAGMAAGYQAGSQHAISVGAKFQRFRMFVPYAFAQIGNVHDVLRSRCIELDLMRGAPEASYSENAEIAAIAAVDLRNMLERYSRKRDERIPIVPADWLHSREREIWTPLVSLACWLGLHADTMKQIRAFSTDNGYLKQRPAKVWHNAQAETDADGKQAAESVLGDMQAIFKMENAPLLTCTEGKGTGFCIETSTMVDALRGLETKPWRVWRGDGLNEITLAALLARYGIAPEQVRIKLPKGQKSLPGKPDNRASVYKASSVLKVKP